MVEQRKIMPSLYINKETDIFYLRNLTPLYEKKDSQYTGKIIKAGTFNLSKHYSIISKTKYGISFYYKSISIYGVYKYTIFDYKIQDELYCGKYIRANKSHHIYFLWLIK